MSIEVFGGEVVSEDVRVEGVKLHTALTLPLVMSSREIGKMGTTDLISEMARQIPRKHIDDLGDGVAVVDGRIDDDALKVELEGSDAVVERGVLFEVLLHRDGHLEGGEVVLCRMAIGRVSGVGWG